ncbi:MAG: hypothetical protein AAF799_04010 [Myxococcota bacterium]
MRHRSRAGQRPGVGESRTVGFVVVGLTVVVVSTALVVTIGGGVVVFAMRMADVEFMRLAGMRMVARVTVVLVRVSDRLGAGAVVVTLSVPAVVMVPVLVRVSDGLGVVVVPLCVPLSVAMTVLVMMVGGLRLVVVTSSVQPAFPLLGGAVVMMSRQAVEEHVHARPDLDTHQPQQRGEQSSHGMPQPSGSSGAWAR